MDFDLSKENIQPLRGGRNATQLGMALQAQNNVELQRELIHKKEEFENAIRNYEGDDPLENWYNYISWVEQSFPKYGHDSNLSELLQNCLTKFENNQRYFNDRRFCKLWIKYIDSHENPIELYQMLYSKGICRGCADFYRAWAYYHEVAGDYKTADLVFSFGEKELAQPFEELHAAHQNMIYAAGQAIISGVDHTRLAEQRQVLTNLRTYRPGRVGSLRIPAAPLGMPSSSLYPRMSTSRSNVSVCVYEDENQQAIRSNTAAPVSVMDIARRTEGVKENLMKPGVWNTGGVSRMAQHYHKQPSFTILEDGANPIVDIHSRGLILPVNFYSMSYETFPDYSPALCIPDPDDPIKIPKYPKRSVYEQAGTEFSIEEIKAANYRTQRSVGKPNSSWMFNKFLDTTELENNPVSEPVVQRTEAPTGSVWKDNSVDFVEQPTLMKEFWDTIHHQSEEVQEVVKKSEKFSIFVDSISEPQPKGCAMKTVFNVLNDDDLVETASRGGLDVATVAQPSDSAKDDQVESTYMEPPACRNLPPASYKENLHHSVPKRQEQQQDCQDFNVTSTQMFNCNLDYMKISTPVQEKIGERKKDETCFTGNKNLSTIYEKTESTASSGGCESRNSNSLKSMLFNSKKVAIVDDNDRYNFNLEQNSKVNAELRDSMMLELLETSDRRSDKYQRRAPNSPPTVNPTMVTPLAAAPSDPFKASLIELLLEKIDFPGQYIYGYSMLHNVPKLNVKKEEVEIGNDRYYIEKMIGKGGFGSIFKAFECNTQRPVALKMQKPPNKWEYYICMELRARLANHLLRDRFMNVRRGYFNDQASILVSDFIPYGSLLDIANKIKQKSGRAMKEILCVFFCIEMLEIINAMHQAKIIHADVKPDNFLINLVDGVVQLTLIDFGCSIDMAMFPDHTTFHRKVTTENFVCCEMRDGRPWSYHTDLFCVAATAHVLLFEKYIHVQNKDNVWSITQRFNRYYRVDCWNMFFSSLLNQQNGPAKVEPLLKMLRSVLDFSYADFNTEMRYLVNLLKDR